MNDFVEKQLKEIDSSINRGEYKKATTYLRSISTQSKKERAVMPEVSLLFGKIADSQSEYAGALNFYNKALSESVSLGYNNGEGKSLRRIGSIHSKKGKYSDALKCFSDALRIFRKISNKAEEGGVYNNIGTIFAIQGKADEARHHFKNCQKAISCRYQH